jgi:hypothetical protein
MLDHIPNETFSWVFLSFVRGRSDRAPGFHSSSSFRTDAAIVVANIAPCSIFQKRAHRKSLFLRHSSDIRRRRRCPKQRRLASLAQGDDKVVTYVFPV